MKRFALATLSVLVTSTAVIPAVNAQITATVPPANAAAIGMGVTPVNLVFLAYQGFFESEGIPKFQQLVNAQRNGNIDAEELVRIAIKMKRLPASTLNDQSSGSGQLDTRKPI
jgi:hypothetical protein